MGEIKGIAKHQIIKRITEALECMSIDDLRNNENVIIHHPYMSMVLTQNSSIVFHFDKGLFDCDGNIINKGVSNGGN